MSGEKAQCHDGHPKPDHHATVILQWVTRGVTMGWLICFLVLWIYVFGREILSDLLMNHTVILGLSLNFLMTISSWSPIHLQLRKGVPLGIRAKYHDPLVNFIRLVPQSSRSSRIVCQARSTPERDSLSLSIPKPFF